MEKGMEKGMEKLKTCTHCHETKPITEFHNNKRYPDGHFTLCKVCTKKAKKTFIQSVKDEIRQYKETHPCIMCGEADPVVLVFHHRNPEEKEFKLSDDPMYGNVSRERLGIEIAKCDILCANCHGKLHDPDPYQSVIMRKYPNGKYYPHRRTKKWLRELKDNKVCEKCGKESHPRVLEYHHLDPQQKSFNIKDGFRYGRDKTMEEIKKCILLCSNCHLKAEEKKKRGG